MRNDSTLTVPEAGLAAVLGTDGAVAAFTGANDVTARDLERSGPAFQGQAKIYAGSCALGPCLVTPDEMRDPRSLQIRCSILRDGQTLFSATTNTARLYRPVAETVAWLCRDNPVPAGTVLVTGTGISVPDSVALADGDLVEIEIEGVGRLSNPVGRVATARR
jgi:2-dehydro-3-deoxy-D-arabinonate dehydratase